MQQNPRIFTPRLTLHIEADSVAELMDALDQVMGSLNVDLIGGANMATDRPAVDLAVYGSKGEADAAADAPKRPRGRPRKTDAAEANTAQTTPPTIAQEAQDEDAHHAAVTAAPTAPAPTAPAADANAMQSLSAADARSKGIELITAHFARNPTCLPQVQQISTKYGVGQFADIPDGQAHAFLADISLLVSGAGQV